MSQDGFDLQAALKQQEEDAKFRAEQERYNATVTADQGQGLLEWDNFSPQEASHTDKKAGDTQSQSDYSEFAQPLGTLTQTPHTDQESGTQDSDSQVPPFPHNDSIAVAQHQLLGRQYPPSPDLLDDL